MRNGECPGARSAKRSQDREAEGPPCRKLASAEAADRLLVLVTDRAGVTHIANKGLLPSSIGSGPRLIGTTEIERLPATAVGFLSYSGPWIPVSVELLWRASGGPWSFFAWRVSVEQPATV